MNVDKPSDVKGKWKRGLGKLRRQSTVSESPTLGSPSIMEEDEDEMQNYFSKLKKKTGLNMLWSGRKFSESIDKDPEIDLSQPVARSTFREITLDSDEEDLQNFIQNLSDDDEGREFISEEDEQSKSSSSDNALMKNMNFAELGADAYGGASHAISDVVEEEEDDDYMPRLVIKPSFLDDSEQEKNGSESSNDTNIFRKNINLMDSNFNLIQSQHSTINSRKSNNSRVVDEAFSEEIISEAFEESRTKSPTKSMDYNYTFDTYRSDDLQDSSAATSENKSYKKNTDRVRDRRSSKGKSNYSDGTKKEQRKNTGKNGEKKHSSDSSSTSESASQSDSRSESRSQSESRSRFSSHTRSRPSKIDSSLTITEDNSPHSRKKTKHPKTSTTKSRTTQTNKDAFANNYVPSNDELLRIEAGLKGFNPTPIATSVVSDDVIQAISSYNPSALALNDLVKYQLQLTRQHIDNSWRLYRAYAAPETAGNYKYTTLKDTMKYIQQNAPSVISYEEALKQIENNDFD